MRARASHVGQVGHPVSKEDRNRGETRQNWKEKGDRSGEERNLRIASVDGERLSAELHGRDGAQQQQPAARTR